MTNTDDFRGGEQKGFFSKRFAQPVDPNSPGSIKYGSIKEDGDRPVVSLPPPTQPGVISNMIKALGVSVGEMNIMIQGLMEIKIRLTSSATIPYEEEAHPESKSGCLLEEFERLIKLQNLKARQLQELVKELSTLI